MTVIRITIEITLPEEEMNVNRIEEMVESKISEAREEIWRRAVEAVEQRAIAAGGVARQRKRERSILTQGGWVNFSRYVVRDSQGKYYCPADRVMGLKPRRRATDGVIRRGCELSAGHSYRTAAGLLEKESRGSISHMALWRWVQKVGEGLRREADGERENVFGLGLAPVRAPSGPGLVVGEMDGTMIRLQRRGGHIEAKCGIVYSRKEQTGRRRWRVADKVTCAAIEPIDEFAERWWLAGEKAFRISDAPRLLLITDGLDIYREAVRDYFPGVVHQLDRWHVHERLHGVVQDEEAESRLKEWLREGRESKVIKWLAGRTFPGREEKHAELMNYLRNNSFSLNAVNTIPSHAAPSSLLRVGSGAVEKTIGVLIAKRFKGQGRSWSAEGAKNLLALCTDRYNSKYPLKGEQTNPNPKPIPVSLN